MARLEIAAPFAGLLESDTAELGSLLQPGGLCATLIGLDPVKIVGFVPETEVDRIEVGARAGARLVTGRELTGEVTFLSRSADPTTRTFRVEITVPNPDLSVRDGQTAEILVEADGAMAHLLPQSALTLDDDGTLGVRTVTQENAARFVPVTLLRDTINGVWVAGLPDEVAVIVLGQEYVTDGVPVEVTWREATQ
jgi:multidrug efflux system membrane fusion protein